jgi:N-acyl-D-aspartate/D-glutamate deacylase
MYNEQAPDRALAMFEAAAAAQARGHGVYLQIPCQPLSFDFTMANAYPFYAHPTFDPVKAYSAEELKPVLRDASFRDSLREDLRHPKPGTMFQGNWDRIVIAAPATSPNAGLANRDIASLAQERGRDPMDVAFDLSLEENLETAFLGQFFNAVDDGVAPLLKHRAGVIALSDAGAHLIYFCDAGFGLNFLGKWVRDRGDFDIVEGVRRLTSHQAGLYGLIDRGHIAVGAHADLLLFDPATVGISPSRRVRDLPGGGRRTIREPKGVHRVFVNGVEVFDGKDYARLAKGPGQLLDKFAPVGPQPQRRAAE